MKISFWNVGIKNKKEDRNSYSVHIIESIISMIKEDKFDIVFLCEVDEEFTQNTVIIETFNKEKICIFNSSEKISSKSSFDICAIYNNENITTNHVEYIIHNNLDDGNDNTGNNIKIGSRFKVKDKNHTNELDFIISHWPSKMTPGYEFRHKDAAENLRTASESIIKDGGQVILMGDYNLSPHEITSKTNLKSYNNKYFAIRSSLRMYNLSFSFYEQHSLIFDGINTSIPMGFGTFISTSNRNTEIGCEVFDQAHVSSSFIQDGPWILNEKGTKIFVNRTISRLIYGEVIQLDHLPISLEIHNNV